MEVFQVSNKEMEEVDEQGAVYTLDGSLDSYGRPAVRNKTGKWAAAAILLLNQGLATLAFFGVAVNLVLFLTRVLGQTNASAANNVSKWTGTVYMFSLVGAFLSDSYWGRYRSCTIFQLIFFLGLASLSVSTHFFLLKPRGCGDAATPCGEHSSMVTGLFYLSLYLVALGYGGYQPNIATFGADQFDGENHKESHSKVSFFSYFYLALNLGSLFSNTILVYFEDDGIWVIGFWASTASAFAALVLFLIRTPRYRHFKPGGNPFSRFGQVLVAAARNWTVQTEGKTFYESDNKEDSPCAFRKMQHTKGFRFLDKAAIATSYVLDEEEPEHKNPWRLCPITQVEEVKCIIRLIPIWMCTIIYSVVFTQMASLFVVQGAAMTTTVSGFKIPPASMSSFDILSVAAFVFIYRRVLAPLISRMRKNETGGLTELERMGIGLIIAMMAMIASGIVEFYRLKYAQKHCPNCLASVGSSLSILWQIPQYVLVGASEVFMYVGQLEFFNSQTPDGLKSFGSALCMTSMSLGNYVSTLLVSIVMKISTQDKMAGWIPSNLNKGHLDRFYFLLAGLTALDFVAYVLCAKWYEYMKREGITEDDIDDTIAA